MNAEEIYNNYKGRKVKCLCNDESGNLVEGYGIVCGYKESWLVLGFHTEYEGCIKEFTDPVTYSSVFKSYRFWNVKHLKEYNSNTSAGHPKQTITNNQFIVIGIMLFILEIGILLFYILG